jgi:signal recognition particle subunit SRP68
MHMKSLHAADSSDKAITGSTRSHIISRLRKAEQSASDLVELLSGTGNDKIDSRTQLEALAYRSMLNGSLDFESQKWDDCIKSYSGVHAAYVALAKTAEGRKAEVFRELLSSTVDPSIRYAAYQLRQPRTVSVESLVSKYVDKSSGLVTKALEVDSSALDTAPIGLRQEKGADSKDAPKTISWRSRTVNIEDANIAQSLALANSGQQTLQSTLQDGSKSLSEKAAAYDEVLNPSQDAVDATKTAIDELTADGVSQGDSRIQSLQVTRTAVNYALVGWRVGRNRLLCGRADGAYLDTENVTLKAKKGSSEPLVKPEGNTRKLTRLRERVVLYDSTIQSLESIKELPGVAADASLVGELESKKAYFTALR